MQQCIFQAVIFCAFLWLFFFDRVHLMQFKKDFLKMNGKIRICLEKNRRCVACNAWKICGWRKVM